MSALVDSLILFFTKIGALLGEGFRILGRLNAWLQAAIIGFFTWLVAFLGWIEDMIDLLIAKLNAMAGLFSDSALVAQGSVPAEWLNFMNGFYPLAETVAMITVLTAIWLIASVVRMIKSWIPTES